MYKTILSLAFCFIMQISFGQDKHVNSFFKTFKNDDKATFMSVKSSEKLDSELSGVITLLGKVGKIKFLNIEQSTKVGRVFKALESKLNAKYETMLKTTSDSSGISIFTDEDEGFYYATIKGEEEYVVISIEMQ